MSSPGNSPEFKYSDSRTADYDFLDVLNFSLQNFVESLVKHDVRAMREPRVTGRARNYLDRAPSAKATWELVSHAQHSIGQETINCEASIKQTLSEIDNRLENFLDTIFHNPRLPSTVDFNSRN